MTRSVYPSDMVCHLWANAHPTEVRTSSASLFALSGVLYSCGRHHVIGAFLKKPKAGGDIILWNENHASVTTTRHASKAWRALSYEQNRRVIRVPHLNESLLFNLATLAENCVTDAKIHLGRCENARQRLSVHIGNAQSRFDAARAIYTYLGNLKAAVNVPTLAGIDCNDAKAAKAAAAKILASIARDEYLSEAKTHFGRATDDLNAANTRIDLYRLRDQESRVFPHGPNYSTDTACGVCRAARDAIANCNRAISAFKRAGANVPPTIYRARAQAAAIEEQWLPLAKIEILSHRRKEVARAKLKLIEILAGAKREATKTLSTGKVLPVISRRSITWLFDHVQDDLPRESEYESLWPDAAIRTREVLEIKTLVRRAKSIIAYEPLASSLESLQKTIYDAEQTMRRGYPATLRVRPTGASVTGNIAKIEAITGKPLPQFFKAIADELLARGAAIIARWDEHVKRAHEKRIADWRNGDNVGLPRDVGPLVRVKGDIVQTSWGASVPLDHAARLIRIAKRVATSGGGGAGVRVGHFTVSQINPDLSAIIGCHSFSADESRHAIGLIEAATANMTIPDEAQA